MRVLPNEVIGTYEIQHGDEHERIELKSNYTYLQDFDSTTREFHHTGRWTIENHWWSGSEITLMNALVPEETKNSMSPYQNVRNAQFIVQIQSSKIVLVLKNSIEWRFEKIK